jgi:hypothetical protein
MLDQRIKLVEQNAASAIVQNKAIPDQDNQAASKTGAEQIFNGLKNQVASGNVRAVWLARNKQKQKSGLRSRFFLV